MISNSPCLSSSSPQLWSSSWYPDELLFLFSTLKPSLFCSLIFSFNKFSHVLLYSAIRIKKKPAGRGRAPLYCALPPSVSLVSVLMTCWTFITTMLLVAELCQCGTESCESISECVRECRGLCVCVCVCGVVTLALWPFCNLPCCLWSGLEKACAPIDR